MMSLKGVQPACRPGVGRPPRSQPQARALPSGKAAPAAPRTTSRPAGGCAGCSAGPRSTAGRAAASRHVQADAGENAGRPRRTRTLPHAPSDNSAEPQARVFNSALSNGPFDGGGAVCSELGRCIRQARSGRRRSKIRPRQRAEDRQLQAARHQKEAKGGRRVLCVRQEHHLRQRGRGGGKRVRLSTCAGLKKKQEKTPLSEKREKIPATLANSGTPDRALSNLPDTPLYESSNKAKLARRFGCAGRTAAERSHTRSPAPRRVTKNLNNHILAILPIYKFAA